MELATAWIHSIAGGHRKKEGTAAGWGQLLCALRESMKSEFEHCLVGWLNGIVVQTIEQTEHARLFGL